MAKKYIDAELQIVRTNNDIVTASQIGVGSTPVTNPGAVQAPGRRRGIWD